jgi:glycerol uptake facilitator protein
MSNFFVAELVGTMLLLLLGDGVVAGVVLKGTKNNNSGWIIITMGWGLAVAMAVFVTARYSGAHLNPAVSLALLVNGSLGLTDFILYVVAQFLGAMLGAILVLVMYFPHFEKTTDAGSVLAVFSTGPAIRNTVFNLVSEIIGTFVLVFVILNFANLGALQPLVVGFLVVGIGMSLGGTTGYAINPARDLGPRLVHQFLPVPNKGSSDWGYAWIPVVGPLIGGVIAALLTQILA